MPVRNHQHMSAVVRIEIHHHKACLIPRHHQGVLVVALRCDSAKEAFPFRRLFLIGEAGDILRTPGRKKSFHTYLSEENGTYHRE